MDTKNENATKRHHGVGYCGVTENVSTESAAKIHCGVGYTGYPKN